ncbi:Alpha/Beta hydrolase protein, partial [Schizophyllum fasciatum]
GDDMTIESMARDLLALLSHIGWQQLALCGSSTGGAVAQQLLLLPHHPQKPAPLPFLVKRVILAASMASTVVSEGARTLQRQPKVDTKEGRLESVRRVVEVTFDSLWYNDPANAQRVEQWAKQFAEPRQKQALIAQTKATSNVNFGDLHAQMPRHIQFLVIHGTLDRFVAYFHSVEIMRKIPWARRVEIGSGRGQIDHCQFGHQWYGYFDAQRWRDVFDVFLDGQAEETKDKKAKL